MSRNLRPKTSTVIVIDDEIDSDDDLDVTFERRKDDSDCEVEYVSPKASGESRDIRKLLVIDLDKPARRAVTRDRNVAPSDSTNRTEARARLERIKQKSEVTIDAEYNDDMKGERQVRSVRGRASKESSKILGEKKDRIEASSSRTKFITSETLDDVFEIETETRRKRNEAKSKDSDFEVECIPGRAAKGSKHCGKTSVIDTDALSAKAISKDKSTGGKSIAGNLDLRKKLLNNKTGAGHEQTNEDMYNNGVQKNVEPEASISAENRKRKGSDVSTAAKKAKKVERASSKKLSAVNKKDEFLSTDESESKGPGQTDNFGENVHTEWSEPDYLSEFNQIDKQIAQNLISLFKDDNTIPFIARYRKEMTGGMEPEQLRSIKNSYDSLKSIKKRGLLILKTIDKLGKWNPEIHSAVTAAKSLEELETIYAPYKPGAKRSLAERAKELGLAPISEAVLLGKVVPSLSSLIDTDRNGLINVNEVRQGIMHIIAEVISKDKTTFEGIRELRKKVVINIQSTKSKSAGTLKVANDVKQKKEDHHKYEKYFHFVASERSIRDYQILAINRGESQKILSVKIIIPDWFKDRLRERCLRKYNSIGKVSSFHHDILNESFDDAYNRLIKKFVTRQVRHELNEKAESASVNVFANNLKKLLLTPPLRGKTVLGIDPGFTHGCKLAMVSQCGDVLETATIYPHTRSQKHSVQVLVDLVKNYRCTVIAVGSETGCRETEKFLTDLIQAGVFHPIDVSYTIVNECGASIYSCSTEAKSEFPNLDPNIISAVSIARRLQDPLAELVKVDPKNLGVGMYQHDLPEKQLQLTLGEVITETVSFVGVDINTASHCLLRRVAGLNAAKATNIINRRNTCGPYKNRSELLLVSGIGKKSYEQCAGFIRILPETALLDASSRKDSLVYLDQTWIHPESYDVAKQFLKGCGCHLTDLGSDEFVQKVTSYANCDRKTLAKQLDTNETTLDIIINGLSMKKGEDIRIREEAPLFMNNFRCIDDLCVNTRVRGTVRNVTSFGTFIDIGVGTNGLLPIGKLKGQVLSLGERVDVLVLSINKDRGRISLTL
ncbi:S1 RNA-binding domain-containing protein 1 [Neodiprion fabricii]|uniref:S1 RNA-binding domain-containing protein 1 n=1 Tax=Neodiprion fabricii TaxID=2872261 RepID=UPI001ED95900|nr:S1 RNA-binding domain-containing protein 1 [Neodiprion fabricii]